MIVQYVRDKHRNPVGTVVATLTRDNEISVGWSRCNKLDRFTKSVAKQIAYERAVRENATEALREEFQTLPMSYCIAIAKIVDRAVRYYKQAAKPPKVLAQ